MTTGKKLDSKECPLCMEILEIDDLNFFPCTCKYQVCRFCWNRIITSENGLCPACRRPYNSEEPASFQPMTTDEIKQIKRKQKYKIGSVDDTRKDFSDKRVLQENLLFVVNLPPNMPRDEELLKSDIYFGKYGTVLKVVVNQTQGNNNNTTSTTKNSSSTTIYTSAYVTYKDKWSAMIALLDVNAQGLNGMRSLKVSFGTTKYCAQFLKGQPCTKRECMYLHHRGDDKASFTKEDMTAGKHTQYEAELIRQFKAELDVSLLPEGHILAPKPAPKPLLECEVPTLLGSGCSSGSNGGGSSSGGGGPTPSSADLVEIISHLEAVGIASSSSSWSGRSRQRVGGDNNNLSDPVSSLSTQKLLTNHSNNKKDATCSSKSSSSTGNNENNNLTRLQHNSLGVSEEDMMMMMMMDSTLSHDNIQETCLPTLSSQPTTLSTPPSTSSSITPVVQPPSPPSSSVTADFAISVCETSLQQQRSSCIFSNGILPCQTQQQQQQSVTAAIATPTTTPANTTDSSSFVSNQDNNITQSNNNNCYSHLDANATLFERNNSQSSSSHCNDDDSWLLNIVSDNLSYLKLMALEEQRNADCNNHSGMINTTHHPYNLSSPMDIRPLRSLSLDQTNSSTTTATPRYHPQSTANSFITTCAPPPGFEDMPTMGNPTTMPQPPPPHAFRSQISSHYPMPPPPSNFTRPPPSLNGNGTAVYQDNSFLSTITNGNAISQPPPLPPSLTLSSHVNRALHSPPFNRHNSTLSHQFSIPPGSDYGMLPPPIDLNSNSALDLAHQLRNILPVDSTIRIGNSPVEFSGQTSYQNYNSQQQQQQSVSSINHNTSNGYSNNPHSSDSPYSHVSSLAIEDPAIVMSSPALNNSWNGFVSSPQPSYSAQARPQTTAYWNRNETPSQNYHNAFNNYYNNNNSGNSNNNMRNYMSASSSGCNHVDNSTPIKQTWGGGVSSSAATTTGGLRPPAPPTVAAATTGGGGPLDIGHNSTAAAESYANGILTDDLRNHSLMRHYHQQQQQQHHNHQQQQAQRQFLSQGLSSSANGYCHNNSGGDGINPSDY